MINFIVAYDIAELEKRKILVEAKDLFKSNVIDEDQYNKIRETYTSRLYSPALHIKVPLFIISLLGLTLGFGLFGIFSVDSIGETGYRILACIVGVALILFTEKVLIQNKLHYSSGVTEAGIYTGIIFIFFAIVSFDPAFILIMPILGFLFTILVSARYLDILSLITAIVFLCWIIFQVLTEAGGMAEAIMPFVFMAVFGFIYLLDLNYEKKFPLALIETHHIILQAVSLMMFYIAGNYFVVRELSIELMGIRLSGQEDIPFALLFYVLTILVPFVYLAMGVWKKSLLLIRVGLITAGLSGITFQHYFLNEYTMLSITVSGGILILASFVLFKYLKQPKNGFTSGQMLGDKWKTEEMVENTLG